MKQNTFPESWGSPVISEQIAPGNPMFPPQAPLSARGMRFQIAATARQGDPIHIYDESQYARLNGKQVFNVNNGASTSILPEANQLRNFLGFRNASASANIYIDFGSQADLNGWLKLTAGQIVLLDRSIPQDAVYAYADAASAVLVVVQSTIPGQAI